MATHSHHEEENHSTYGGYFIGFVLSVILTAASFWVVLHGGFTPENALIGLGILAVVQIVVHLFFFLHLSTAQSQRWNVISFGFTVMTAVIVIGGTLWIMHNVSMNMMIR
jgi:cytochrome o ubiquinol oxidase operon protein cyoD